MDKEKDEKNSKNPTNATKLREKKKQLIIESLKRGASITKSCAAAKIDRSTFYDWRRRSPKFDQAVYDALDGRTQIVEDALYKSCITGNVTAQIFYLKNRSKGRWKDKFDFGTDDIRITVDLEDDNDGGE